MGNGLEKHWEVLKYKMQVFNVSKCLIYIKVLGSFPTFRQILKTKNVKRKLKIKQYLPYNNIVILLETDLLA